MSLPITGNDWTTGYSGGQARSIDRLANGAFLRPLVSFPAIR